MIVRRYYVFDCLGPRTTAKEVCKNMIISFVDRVKVPPYRLNPRDSLPFGSLRFVSVRLFVCVFRRFNKFFVVRSCRVSKAQRTRHAASSPQLVCDPFIRLICARLAFFCPRCSGKQQHMLHRPIDDTIVRSKARRELLIENYERSSTKRFEQQFQGKMTTLVTRAMAPLRRPTSVEHPLGSVLVSRAGWMVSVRVVELLYTFRPIH